ncbi:MAG: DUF2203 domain-containing protein [Actinobacteria bacterium]|nr:DUF2203 domain-containing protein [Actinomycetota bacterium]
MSDKIYTLQEANALLDHLAPALVELRTKYEASARIRELIAVSAAGNGSSPARDRWSRTLARVAELLERIEEWGVIIRDIDTGLIDFPARIGGREAFYCWRLGEPEVAHWHSSDDGFKGRRPL